MTQLIFVYGPKRVTYFRIILRSRPHFLGLNIGAGWSSGCSLSTVLLAEDSIKETQLGHQEVSQGELKVTQITIRGKTSFR